MNITSINNNQKITKFNNNSSFISNKINFAGIRLSKSNKTINDRDCNNSEDCFVSRIFILDKKTKEVYEELRFAAMNDRPEYLEFCFEENPQEFKKAILHNDRILDENSVLPIIHLAIDKPKCLEVIAQKTPEEFKEGILAVNFLDNTAIDDAIEEEHNESLRMIAQYAPEEFKQAILMKPGQKGKLGNYAVSLAVENKNYEALELIAKTAPQEFMKTVFLSDDCGFSAFSNALLFLDKKFFKIVAKTAIECFKQRTPESK